MPDTPENQSEYPQHTAQQPGLGFSIVRLVVLSSLATAMVCGMSLGPYAGKETGEPALFRQLLEGVDPRTILLADRYYCSYFPLALALLGRRDFVVRLHQCRKTDFCKTQRLGKEMWTCLLAYNLIRKAMLQAAGEGGLSPRELSFTAAMQTIAASFGTLASADRKLATRLIAAQVSSLAEQTVGNRPNRVEPCAVKRRAQPIALLTTPRDEARAELLRNRAA